MLHFSKVLHLLDHERYYCASALAQQLNVPRAAIYACIDKIESLGIPISRARGSGYRLCRPLDLLSKAAIFRQLPNDLKAQLDSIHCLHEIDSTNRYAGQLPAPAGGFFSLVAAEAQTSGRGRRARRWVSPYAANVTMSIVWSLQGRVQAAGILSPLLACGIVQSLQKAGVSGLGLKWPNDIYSRGKKLAGILIECRPGAGAGCKIVIGIGVNVGMSRWPDVVIDQAWTDIISNTQNWRVSRSTLVAHLTDHIIKSLMAFECDDHMEIMNEWRKRDITWGKNVQIHAADNIHAGIARGIDAQGRLLLETSNRLQKISVGEVSLRVSQ